VDFTTGDTDVDIDLASVLQHETGLFFGLAPSHETDAIMDPFYLPGAIERTLKSDDIAAICAAYPPGALRPGG
jgi:Matrixin